MNADLDFSKIELKKEEKYFYSISYDGGPLIVSLPGVASVSSTGFLSLTAVGIRSLEPFVDIFMDKIDDLPDVTYIYYADLNTKPETFSSKIELCHIKIKGSRIIITCQLVLDDI